MASVTEIIKELESLGYTTYEAKVLYSLVEGHMMTGAEVAKTAKIPRSSAYTILKKFAEKGICNEIQTSSVIQYELIDPKIVRDKIEKELHDTYKSRISKLTDSFEKLEPVFRARELDAKKIDVELIKGYNAQRYFKFLDLLKSSKEEILIMNRMEAYVQQEVDEASVNFYKKGGVVKSIYEASQNFKIKVQGVWKDVGPAGLVKMCEDFEKQGEQIRLTESVPQIIYIFDRRTVYVSLVDPTIPKYNRSDIIVKNENFANFMVVSFNAAWEKAEIIGAFKKRTGIE